MPFFFSRLSEFCNTGFIGCIGEMGGDLLPFPACPLLLSVQCLFGVEGQEHKIKQQHICSLPHAQGMSDRPSNKRLMGEDT